MWENVRILFPTPKVLFGKGVINELPNVISELFTTLKMSLSQTSIDHPVVLLVIGSSSMKSTGKNR